MFFTDQLIFRRSLDTSERVLYRGRIIGVEGPVVAAWFETSEAAVEEGVEFQLEFIVDGKRLKQRAEAVASTQIERGVEVTFRTRGGWEPAEDRADFRASALGAEVWASIDGEEHCAVLDVSAGGLAVWLRHDFEVGTPVKVSLRYEDGSASGVMTVVGAAEVSGHLKRYGLRGDEPSDTPLMQMLRRVNIDLQRQQLARLAGRE